jgi:hypothetical protein
MLLVVETNESQLAFIDDNTVEGAVILMEKIGNLLDSKLASILSKEGEKRPVEIDTV